MTPVTLLTPASTTPGQELSRPVRHLAKMPARDSDRIFWQAHAKRNILRGLIALESGRIAFGDWERLHLSAAIDQFRYGHFESSAEYAQRIMNPEAKPRSRRSFPLIRKGL